MQRTFKVWPVNFDILGFFQSRRYEMTIKGLYLSDLVFVCNICCCSSFVYNLDKSSRQDKSLPACWAPGSLRCCSLGGELFCLDLVSFTLSHLTVVNTSRRRLSTDLFFLLFPPTLSSLPIRFTPHTPPVHLFPFLSFSHQSVKIYTSLTSLSTAVWTQCTYSGLPV